MQTKTTLIVPKDSIVSVIAVPADARRMVDVAWDTKVVRVFAQDLRERGERLKAAPGQ